MYTVVSDYGIISVETFSRALEVAEGLQDSYCCDVYVLEGNRRVMELIADD